jgi:hypothetical protein
MNKEIQRVRVENGRALPVTTAKGFVHPRTKALDVFQGIRLRQAFEFFLCQKLLRRHVETQPNSAGLQRLFSLDR